MPCQGRSCEDHPFGCGVEVLRRGVVVRFWHERMMVECCEEDTLGVFLVKDGIDSCKVGFLPRYLVPRMKMFNGAVAQVVEMIDPEDSNKFVQKRYEKFRGF